MWYRLAQSTDDGRRLDQQIKSLVRRSKFFAKLFKHYGVEPRDLWRVQFRVADLKGEYAHSHGDEIVLDRRLAEMPLEEVMHYVAHELSHWLTRQREAHHYFSDPEEIAAFEWAIAHEMERGRDMDHIVSVFLPLVEHNCPAGEANKRLVQMIARARRLCK